MILAVDPGINVCGVGLFGESWPTSSAGPGGKGFLIRGWLARTSLPSVAKPLERVTAMARAVIRSLTASELQGIKIFVGEWPQVYPPRGPKRKRVDPNVALVPLAGVIAAVAAQLPITAELIRYYPRDWKGTLDGDAFTSRIVRHMDQREVDAVEPCPEGLRHNVIDAVGIGLFYLGRLGRHRVISRGAPRE